MKLRNKLAAITGAAMLAFAGAGYAAWVFNKDVEVSSNASIVITSESEQGTLVIDTDSLYIILDQDGIYYASDSAGANEVTELELTYTAVAAGNLGENMSVTFSLEITGATSDWSHYVSGLADPADMTETVVNGANQYSFVLPSLSYVAANKPSTESEYDAMVAALDGDQLTFTVIADAAADDVADQE